MKNKAPKLRKFEILDESSKLQPNELDSSKKSHNSKSNKIFKKKLEDGTPVFEVDNSRLKKLNFLSNLELPERTVKVLSKLTINHQLKHLGDLIETTENTLTYTATVNKSCKNFTAVNEDGEVFIKIFTQKNHTKPDVKAAEEFAATAYHGHKEDCSCYVNLYHSCTKHLSYIAEDLKILQLENVVIIKKMGSNENPTKKLVDMIKSNRSKIGELLQSLLRSYKLVYWKNWHFNRVESFELNIDNVFHHNDVWIFVDESKIADPNEIPTDVTKAEIFATNVITILSNFQRFQMNKTDLRKCFNDNFSGGKIKKVNFLLVKQELAAELIEEFFDEK